jgi:hypothetical protein
MKEITMDRIRRFHPVRRTVGLLAGLATALLAYVAMSPAAFAMRVPAPDTTGVSAPASGGVHTVIADGMPGWQITLIAIGAALAAAAVAVLLDRARAARRFTAAA